MYSITYYSREGDDREINEDAMLINNKVVSSSSGTVQIERKENFLLAVADGMGGYARGDIASSMVLHHLASTQPRNKHAFVQILIEAKNLLEEFASQKNIKLGTAFAGVLCKNNECLVVNVGDCRVYKVTSDTTILLSKDHTLVSQLQNLDIDKRIIRQQHNILTSAITGGMGSEDFEIFQKSFLLEKGEKLVICSDGFWNVFEKDIPKITQSKEPLKYMKKLLKERDVNDDCTFILLKEGRGNAGEHKVYDIIKSYFETYFKRILKFWNLAQMKGRK